MGAAVGPDGTPGAAVLRRTQMALRVAAQLSVAPIYLPTGGARPGAPPEAHVMRRLLRRAGVRPNQIIVEDRAEDTLQSVLHCAEIVRRLGADEVVVCTDAYHEPRCRALFRLAGISTRPAPCRSEASAGTVLESLREHAREALALPLDAVLLLASRVSGQLAPVHAKSALPGRARRRGSS